MPVAITTVSISIYPRGPINPDVTGHATVAAALSIEFRAQLLLVDSPLPTFFCFISCSVFISDSSPPSYVAYAEVENIPLSIVTQAKFEIRCPIFCAEVFSICSALLVSPDFKEYKLVS